MNKVSEPRVNAKVPHMSDDSVRFCIEWEIETTCETLSRHQMASENISSTHLLGIVKSNPIIINTDRKLTPSLCDQYTLATYGCPRASVPPAYIESALSFETAYVCVLE